MIDLLKMLNDLRLTIEEFAVDTNIHPDNVQEIITGSRELTEKQKKDIEEIYGIKVLDYETEDGCIKKSHSGEKSLAAYIAEKAAGKKPEEMTAGERIYLIRNELKLSLNDFGARIGVTRAAISLLENGNREVTAAMKNNICRTFYVSTDWLESGKGDMFNFQADGLRGEVMKKLIAIDDGSDYRKLYEILLCCITEYQALEKEGKPDVYSLGQLLGKAAVTALTDSKL